MSVLMHIPSSVHTCQVLSGSEWGNMLVWEAGHIKVELCRSANTVCHHGPINQIMLDEGEVITIGSDGWVRVSFLDSWTVAPTFEPFRSPSWFYPFFFFLISRKGHFMKKISGHLFPGSTHFKECFSYGKYLNSSQN